MYAQPTPELVKRRNIS